MMYDFAKNNVVDEPLLCLTFDDGYKTDYTFVYPEMVSRGMRGTTYVVGYYTDYISKYMTSAELLDLHQNGWDIQCHTFDHPYLSTLTPSLVHKQMRDNDNKFKAIGLPLAEHHAFPYGAYNHDTRKVISNYRKSQRATAGTVPSVQSLDEIDLTKIGAQIADIETVAKYNEIKVLLDQAIEENKVLVLYWHEMTESKKAFFTQFLDYAVSTGIRTVTHKELYEIIKWRNFDYKFIQ